MAGVDTSHLCCMITATTLNATDMLLPGIPVLFPCKCPLCSVLVVAECGSNLHAMPGQRDVDNVYALQLSCGFQVKAITLSN